MSYTKRITRPEDIVNPGESVAVMIKDIDLDQRRISLSMRDAEGDPWVDIKEKYKNSTSMFDFSVGSIPAARYCGR